MDKSVISYSEAQRIDQEYSENHDQWGLVLDRKILIFLAISIAISIFMGISYLKQVNKLNELKVQEAYTICSLIDAQEDHLLLKYQVLPEHVGLGTLRDAWKDNPCYETSITYSDALYKVIKQLEENQKPFVPGNLGTEVKV